MIGLPTETDEDVLRDRRDRGARAGDRAAPPAGRAGDGLGVDARAQAAHAVSVGGDGQRGGDRAQAGAAGRAGARAAREPQDAREPAVPHRGDLLARRSARGRAAGGGLPARLPLRQLGRRAPDRSVGAGGGGDVAAHGVRRRAPARHAAGDGAAALEPHRHRARAGLPGQGVPQGAQGSPVAAVREAVQEAAAPEQRRGGRGGRQGQAHLLRLRHRLRPRRHEGRAALLPAPHERLGHACAGSAPRAKLGRGSAPIVAPRKPRPPQDPTRPPPRVAAGEAARLPRPLHQARARRLSRAPRSGAPPAAHLPARRARDLLLGRVSPQAGAVVRAGARARHPVAGRDPRREAGRRPSARRGGAASRARLAGRDRHPRGRARPRQRPRARPRDHRVGDHRPAAGRHRRGGRPRAVRRRRAAQDPARIGQGDRAHRRRAQDVAVALAVRGRGGAAPARLGRRPDDLVRASPSATKGAPSRSRW